MNVSRLDSRDRAVSVCKSCNSLTICAARTPVVRDSAVDDRSEEAARYGVAQQHFQEPPIGRRKGNIRVLERRVDVASIERQIVIHVRKQRLDGIEQDKFGARE